MKMTERTFKTSEPIEAPKTSEPETSETYRAPCCSFIPPYILEKIAVSPAVSEETRTAAQETLRISNTVRHERTQTFNAQSGAQRTNLNQPRKSRQVFVGQVGGVPARSEGQQETSDRQVNDCYEGLGIVYDFFHDVFGRNSIDGAGSSLIGVVHYATKYNNAQFDGEKMLFGDGDGVVFSYFTSSRLIITHELVHWLTAKTAELKYQNQSGALNESMSDVFACVVDQYHLNQDVNRADWTIGQKLRPVGSRAYALRSMKAPGTAFENDPIFGNDVQPSHMNNYNHTPADNGGVHINSGIPNHAFYLAAIGIGGKSWEQAGRIWYNALTDPSISPSCTFAQFARLTVEHARVYGDRVRKAVQTAWAEVGVLDANVPDPDPSPPNPPPQTDGLIQGLNLQVRCQNPSCPACGQSKVIVQWGYRNGGLFDFFLNENDINCPLCRGCVEVQNLIFYNTRYRVVGYKKEGPGRPYQEVNTNWMSTPAGTSITFLDDPSSLNKWRRLTAEAQRL